MAAMTRDRMYHSGSIYVRMKGSLCIRSIIDCCMYCRMYVLRMHTSDFKLGPVYASSGRVIKWLTRFQRCSFRDIVCVCVCVVCPKSLFVVVSNVYCRSISHREQWQSWFGGTCTVRRCMCTYMTCSVESTASS